MPENGLFFIYDVEQSTLSPLGVVNPGYAASSLRFDPLICRVSRNRQIVCL